VRYLAGALLVAATTGLAMVLGLVGLPDPEMLYLLAIMITATWLGRGPSVLAAGLSVLAYDFFFVAPHHTLSVADSRYLLTFAMMFGVGLVIGSLTDRLRREQREASATALRVRTEELRSALLSAVSHDLRTPLATITGAATALRDGTNLSAEARHELLDDVCEEAERLERLVSNLLEMSRLESGAAAVHREWVPVEELVGAALGRLEARLADRPVDIQLAPDLPLVPVDPVLFQLVLINLIENALKYAPGRTPIELGARATPGVVTLEVADRGPGFAAGELPRVFERFHRGHHPGIGGVGLGLAIARGIVEAHGGTIQAESRPGGGACVTVRLPIVGTPPAPPPAEADDA
jgi:two-component system sensor histidine kinase KdpD